MPLDEVETWTIRVVGGKSHWQMLYQHAKGICYLSAHTKLADFGKAVTLSNRQLAEDFRTAIQEVMRRRHGSNVELVVERGGGKKCVDDELVAARIAQRVFAPNCRPVPPSEVKSPPSPGGRGHKTAL